MPTELVDLELGSVELLSVVDKGASESEAQFLAVRELQEETDTVLDDIVTQVEAAGGTVNRPAAPEQEAIMIPTQVGDQLEMVDANELVKSLDDEMGALEDVLRCAYR